MTQCLLELESLFVIKWKHRVNIGGMISWHHLEMLVRGKITLSAPFFVHIVMLKTLSTPAHMEISLQVQKWLFRPHTEMSESTCVVFHCFFDWAGSRLSFASAEGSIPLSHCCTKWCSWRKGDSEEQHGKLFTSMHQLCMAASKGDAVNLQALLSAQDHKNNLSSALEPTKQAELESECYKWG